MTEHDLSGVPVARRTEVRRRIALIEGFLALPSPTPDDRAALRSELGVSRPMLYVLLNAWRKHRDPAKLPGAFAPRALSGRRATRKTGAEPLIAATLDTLDAEASGADFRRALAARCAAAGVDMPSKSHLLRRLRDHRANAPVSFADVPLLYIDFCAVDAGPMGQGFEDPIAIAAIMLPERTIVAHATTWRRPDARDTAAVLAQAVKLGIDRGIALPGLDGLDMTVLRAVLTATGLAPSVDCGFAPWRRFRPAAGETLGGLPLHPGRTARSRSADAPPRRVRDAVAAIVSEAVAQHNAGHARPPAPAPGFDARRTSELLRWVAIMPD